MEEDFLTALLEDGLPPPIEVAAEPAPAAAEFAPVAAEPAPVAAESAPVAADDVELDKLIDAVHDAELDGAELDGAELDGAKLDGAELDGAELDGAELDGAELDADEALPKPDTVRYEEADLLLRAPVPSPVNNITGFWKQGSLEVAARYQRAGRNPCVLNFANNFQPGGPGGPGGAKRLSPAASTQEETLFHETDLGAHLRPEYYPIDDVADEGRRWRYDTLALLYTPAVQRRRGGRPFAVVSAAAIQAPWTKDGRYLHEADRNVTRRKIGMILSVAAARGHDVVVAGEWGCGAFLNPPYDVCEIWARSASAWPELEIAFPVMSAEFARWLDRAVEATGRRAPK